MTSAPRAARAVLLVVFTGTASAYADAPALALDTSRDSVRDFIGRMSEKHGFSVDTLTAVLAQAQSQQTILDAMAKPAEKTFPWYRYRERFVTEQRIAEGVAFWQEHRELLEQVARERGVAPEYLVAILGVETYYGRIMGGYRVIDALSTLAFDYPPRSGYFTGELEQYLLLVREDSLDALAPLGSYAGAMGAPQFMPGSIRRYAVDGDGDGARNLWTDWEDVLASIANYFRKHGWQPDAPVLAEAVIDQANAHDLDTRRLELNETVGSLREKGVQFETSLPADAPAMLIAADQPDSMRFRVGLQNFYVITRYNRSALYAMAVHDLARELSVRVFSDDASS
ncbi:MAG TPA: lytic murein transglycosylase B [Steroidobacteraceae bacterium]|nr:lytic murein transglycosylase B [Steroidobacteraceae bacterium]